MSLGHRRGSTRPSRAVNGAVVPLLLILSAIAGAAGPAIPVAEAAPATGDGAGTLPADSLAAARDDSLGALRTGEAPVDSTGQLPGMDANEESELQAAAEEKRPTMTPMQRALAHADSVVATAEADSIRADRDAVAETELVPEGFNWFTSLAPTMKAEITSDVQKVVKNGSLSATTKWLDGGTSNTTWSLNNTSYRQQDRDRRNRALRAGFVHPLGGLADLHVDFDHNTSEDENRVSPTQTVSVDYEANTANLGLGGGRDLSEGFAHAWRLRGRFEDVTQDNRGTNNDRNLAAGGLTSYWQHRRDHLSLDGRYGYDRAGGSRQLRGRAQDATTTQDTLSTHLR